MNKQLKLAGMAATVCLILALTGGSASASPLAVTNEFQPNTPATAESVNQNFDDVEAAVNDNDARITTNTGDIADNFSLINDNATDIDNLQTGQRPATRTVIDIDCTSNPDVLVQPPYTENFYPYTTFNITGDCNGPFYITSDGIRVVGAEPNRGASIVLPATATPEEVSNGAVFADGAHDLRIVNVTIDLSAYGTAAAEGSDAAGVYARNAFVRLVDVDIIGGLYGINPFRNAIIRLENVNINDFVNEGITVGDQSVVSGRGPVTVSSSRTDGSYLLGVGAYRNGTIDFRAGLSVSVPPQLANFDFPDAIISGDHSMVRVRNAGTVSITGPLSTYRIGIIDMDAGTVAGDIDAGGGGRIDLSNVIQTSGDVSALDNSTIGVFSGTQVEGVLIENNSVGIIFQANLGDIEVIQNSSLRMINSTQTTGSVLDVAGNSSAIVSGSTTGELSIEMSSALDHNNGSFEGGQIDRLSVVSIFDSSTSANLVVYDSILDYTGPGSSLNGNTVYQCSAISFFVEPNVAATGIVDPGCPP